MMMTSKTSNFFLVIEGLDGSGKTEIVQRLVQVLQETLNDRVKLTFEPHDPSCAGLFIRQVLKKKIEVSLSTLALAFAANRADHCNREIEPFITEGENRIIVCDRYYLSSLVYQSSSEITFEEVMNLNIRARKPDLIIYFDAAPRTCYERMRRRPEDKELFEKSLTIVKKKYKQAIEFLRARGETIVEVDADGSILEVLNNVLGVLSSEYGPSWLQVQYPLSLASLPEVFSLNGERSTTLANVAQRVFNAWNPGGIMHRELLIDAVATLQNVITTELSHATFNELGSLFLDYINLIGYQIVDKLPWTNLDAFELEVELPLGIKQRGTALLLGGTQRYDTVTQKILMAQLSDFMLILDPRPARLVHSYQRDMVVAKSGMSPSPSTRIIGRDEIAQCIMAFVLAIYEDEYLLSLGEQRTGIHEIVKEMELHDYWQYAISAIAL
jgi:dTMP kinase